MNNLKNEIKKKEIVSKSKGQKDEFNRIFDNIKDIKSEMNKKSRKNNI